MWYWRHVEDYDSEIIGESDSGNFTFLNIGACLAFVIKKICKEQQNNRDD